MASERLPHLFSTSLIAETDLPARSRVQIRDLLTAAFPDYASLWVEHDSWAGPLDYRLLLRDPGGRLAGHLGFGRRWVEVGGTRFLIAGIGTVAVPPDLQGRGLGRYLLQQLRTILRSEVPVDYGFLQCREAVVGFYQRAGFAPIPQQVRSFDPALRRWQTDQVPALILPVRAALSAWPRDGVLDLMGMPW